MNMLEAIYYDELGAMPELEDVYGPIIAPDPDEINAELETARMLDKAELDPNCIAEATGLAASYCSARYGEIFDEPYMAPDEPVGFQICFYQAMADAIN